MLATTKTLTYPHATPPTLHFRSTLICNGHRRPLPARVEEFLRHDGAILAAVLRSDTPLSISAIATAYEEYVAEHPESLCIEPENIEWGRSVQTAVDLIEHILPTLLTRFVFWGLAEAIPQPIGDCP